MSDEEGQEDPLEDWASWTQNPIIRAFVLDPESPLASDTDPEMVIRALVEAYGTTESALLALVQFDLRVMARDQAVEAVARTADNTSFRCPECDSACLSCAQDAVADMLGPIDHPA